MSSKKTEETDIFLTELPLLQVYPLPSYKIVRRFTEPLLLGVWNRLTLSQSHSLCLNIKPCVGPIFLIRVGYKEVLTSLCIYALLKELSYAISGPKIFSWANRIRNRCMNHNFPNSLGVRRNSKVFTTSLYHSIFRQGMRLPREIRNNVWP